MGEHLCVHVCSKCLRSPDPRFQILVLQQSTNLRHVVGMFSSCI